MRDYQKEHQALVEKIQRDAKYQHYRDQLEKIGGFEDMYGFGESPKWKVKFSTKSSKE